MISKNNIRFIILGMILLFALSCRKEKLTKGYENVLVGQWTSASNSNITLTIQENGLLTISDSDGKITCDARIANLKLIKNSDQTANVVAPQIKYYYKIKIKKRKWSSEIYDMWKYDHLLYTNGELDTSGNFIFDSWIIFSDNNGEKPFNIYYKK